MTQYLNKNYNLEERTAKFAEEIVLLVKICPKNSTTFSILDQLIRAGTSIGANYCEANGASSIDEENLKQSCRNLWQEAKELSMIFATIASKTV